MKYVTSLLLLSNIAVAGVNKVQDFDCTVKSFETKTISFSCPTIKNTVVLDRDLFEKSVSEKFQAGAKAKVALTLDQVAKFNSPPKAEKK